MVVVSDPLSLSSAYSSRVQQSLMNRAPENRSSCLCNVHCTGACMRHLADVVAIKISELGAFSYEVKPLRTTYTILCKRVHSRPLRTE